MLFKYLNDDAFLIFSRGNRHLYEACLLAIYERYFDVGTQFPTPQEVVHVVYDVLSANPHLVDDEGELQALPEIVSKRRRRIRFVGNPGTAGDKALRLATHVYTRLVGTGWLEEEEYGLRVTVDMPMGALLVMQRLSSIRNDISPRFGGVVVLIKSSLENASQLAKSTDSRLRSDASQALDTALKQVNDFTKTLRAILSDLKRVRRALLEASTQKDRIATYFDQFIGQLLLKDFQSILTTNHPYRHRDRIIELARTLSLDEIIMEALAEGYLASGMAGTTVDGYRQAEHNLLSIETAFETIGEMFERISQFRRGLEMRLRNTVRYAEQGGRGLVPRAESLIKQLEALIASDPSRYDRATVPSPIEARSVLLSENSLATTRQPRRPIVIGALAKRKFDQIYLMRKKLRGAFLQRMNPTPAMVRAYLQRLLPGEGAISASEVVIGDIDEFLVFDAARRMAVTGELPPEVGREFAIELLEGTPPHDDDWVRCSNFSVRRLVGGDANA
ncbi:MAG: hypothetical protein BGO82_01380 [Devosia sp. 67-54]|uniref:Wadjet anti-phage system protein JetA family protein n=1 Tax=unclassified Devosia TaxID=196773 RepID=UPI000964DCD1|nr:MULTISPECIES: Wadjet anti-phage system protein JetA family protein [unclassified Devosia]MBN9305884.1 hypothetical protein [Devosia sp.]OJX16422.1 MAG: hypothetical protein BGO82_01380 [Devosia sp. 67-54]